MDNFATRLKECRKVLTPYTAKEFAEKLNIKYPTYATYEQGKRTPSNETLKKIAYELGITIDDLLDEQLSPHYLMINNSMKPSDSNVLVSVTENKGLELFFALKQLGFDVTFGDKNKRNSPIILKNNDKKIYTFKNLEQFEELLLPMFNYATLKANLLKRQLIEGEIESFSPILKQNENKEGD